MTADIVKVYVDQTGFISKTVFIFDDPGYNHTLHDESGLTGIVLSAKEYQNTDPPVPINGVAYSSTLYTALAAKVHPVLRSKILANNADPDTATLAKVSAVAV